MTRSSPLISVLILVLGATLGCTTPGPAALRPLAPAAPDLRADPQPLPLPYAEVEAEAGLTTGSSPAATTALYDPGCEASGRRYVALPPGARLVLSAPRQADSLVVRYSWPDETPDGTLELSIDGGPARSLVVTSRLSWETGRPAWGSDNVWREQGGSPRHFWDEVQVRVPVFAEGSEVTLTNPAASKAEVLVDLVDFELVAPPVLAPTGAVNFADFHPDPTGQSDVTDLLQMAADRARGGTLYVPEGTYRIGAVFLGQVEVQGAGLWRTRLVGPLSQLRFTGPRARVADLAIFGETHVRNDASDEENGLAGNPGPGTLVERVWIEHKKCAFWVGDWGGRHPVTNLTLSEDRFRNLMADGVNLCSGTTASTVQNCLIRNSGDDALAAWSPKNGGPAGGSNRFIGNLIQTPWVASGIALYGGGPFVVEGNLVKDTVTTGSGIYVSANFGAWPFAGLVEVRKNWLIRCGAHESDTGGPTGAIRLLASDASMAEGQYLFTDNTIVDPLESAVSFQGPRALGLSHFQGLRILGLAPGASVVYTRPNAREGRAEFEGVEVSGPASQDFPGGRATITF